MATKMADPKASVPEVPKPAIEVSEVKEQIQDVLDLRQNKEIDLKFVQKKYSLRELGAGEDPADFEKRALAEVQKLVVPPARQIEALLTYATAQSYRENKDVAFKTGDFLTPDLQRIIVNKMQSRKAFAELSVKECKERFRAGLQKGSKGALELLDAARAEEAAGPEDF